MYTKEDMRELMRQFEGMVRGLNTVFCEEDILKLVSLICNIRKWPWVCASKWAKNLPQHRT